MSAGPPTGITGDEKLLADRRTDRWIRRLFFGCAALTIVTTVAIFLVLFDNAANYFLGARITELIAGATVDRQVTFTEFFTGTRWAPSHAFPAHGVLQIVWGTMVITVGAALISIPVGTATALYLAEYAEPATRNRLKPILEVLAGIPTIVYGFFAVSFVTPVFVDGMAAYVVRPIGRGLHWVGSGLPAAVGVGGFDITVGAAVVGAGEAMMAQHVGRYSMLAGIIVVGIMTIPMVSSISEDAMQAVPDDLRDGAYALGATKMDVSIGIVIPAAASGILASYVLAVSRAIGETMAVTLAAGFNANITLNPFEEIMTMTAYMVSMARGEAAVGTVEYQSLFAVGLVLFLLTLLMNVVNDLLKRRFQESYR